jgi:hypothetical protein
MNTEQVKKLLEKLQGELRDAELDDETRALVRELDTDINDLLATDTESDDSSVIVERAKELEAGFAAEYPAAERFMREVIDALVRMGV